jgi:hypothetical protein
VISTGLSSIKLILYGANFGACRPALIEIGKIPEIVTEEEKFSRGLFSL